MTPLTRFTFVSRVFETRDGYWRNSHVKPLYLDVTAYKLEQAEELAYKKAKRPPQPGYVPHLTLVYEVPA